MFSSLSLSMPSSDVYFFSIILLLLFIIVGLYFYFKSKLLKQNSSFFQIIHKAQDDEKNKNALLVSMGDDIYRLTQNLVKTEIEKKDSLEVEILTSTNNLRELLKIQANNIEIYNEKYVFSHMLDDISTYLSSNFKDRNTEIIFDIDEKVPRYLTGDIAHFGRIINNILEFSILATPEGNVTLSISCNEPNENTLILNVQIKDNGEMLSMNGIEKLFELNYTDIKKLYIGPRLYIAKKLTLAMGGTLTAKNIPSKNISSNNSVASGNIFILQIPMQLNEDSGLQEFTAFKERVRRQKVVIYSEKSATEHSIKKLFSYFYDDVSVVTKEEIDRRRIDFGEVDLIILDDTFLNVENNEYLKQIKQHTKIHIVIFRSIFTKKVQSREPFVDANIYMPSNLERIVELITALEFVSSNESVIKEPVEVKEVIAPHKELLVYKDSIAESKNIDIDCFSYFKGTRLLIVEDNLINQKILVSVLKKSGMEIEIANNGQEALDYLFIEKKKFDMILMDISMPIMDGLIATKYIRERDTYNDVPIITFTAFALGAEIEEMFSVGCNAYLTKPLNIKKLYNVFNMFLTQTKREISLKKSIEIQGLDIEVGIYNADESEALYKETLKEFVLVYRDMVDLVPKWLKEKHYKRVKLACNEIEGFLSAIGAYEMKLLIGEMQKKFLYNNEVFLDKYILLYPEKLKNLITTIEYYLAKK